MKIPHKTLERKLFKEGYEVVFGVDEVGMGCLAGPVVVCAVACAPEFYLQDHKTLTGLRESKLLQAHQREQFAKELIKIKSLKFKIASCSVTTIDQINIYQASRQAMRVALSKLSSPHQRGVVLVDGNKKIPGVALEQQAIVHGDRKIFAIACASILAKVFRDKLMVRYAKKFPGYGFEQHKGYGTKLHREKIKELGPTPWHRRSFRW